MAWLFYFGPLKHHQSPMKSQTKSEKFPAASLDGHWEAAYSDGLRVRYPYDSVVSFVFKNRPKDVKNEDTFILEVGCGTGNNLTFLATEGFNAYGIDGSDTAIEFAKNFLQSKSLSANLSVGNFTELPYEKEKFHLVIDRGALTCTNMEGLKNALQSIHRVLKPGGRFLFNPYSDRHGSFMSGNTDSDGTTRNITEGALVGAGQILFLGKKQILDLLSENWKLLSLQHIEYSQELSPKAERHCEWEIIAQKIS